ncbi:hypothetical protein [Streptomyces sp. NPDC101234]|uniref:hypothetical protein n=1 Tax=Streptomyces sp. NPDC101234 TaxID=3366138 RepID=UPI003828FE4E
MYQNGEYSATGWYGSLPSHITVFLTLTEGVVSDVSVTPHAKGFVSRWYQKRFAKAVPGVVAGKHIDDIRLDRLAGSSVTTDGFNDALERIKADAAR